jgi:protein-S-isoprenylcysteine O-methyltransferase Ste14
VINASSFYFLLKLVGVFCLSGFTWAAIFHFKHPKKPDFRKYIVSFCAFAATVINLFILITLKETSNYQFAISFCLFCSSSAIFWPAIFVSRGKLDFAFSTQDPPLIIKNGPYKFMKHPFYVSYSIAWLAGFILTYNLAAAIAGLTMVGLYYSAARLEEKRILESELREAYLEYISKKSA